MIFIKKNSDADRLNRVYRDGSGCVAGQPDSGLAMSCASRGVDGVAVTENDRDATEAA